MWRVASIRSCGIGSPGCRPCRRARAPGRGSGSTSGQKSWPTASIISTETTASYAASAPRRRGSRGARRSPGRPARPRRPALGQRLLLGRQRDRADRRRRGCAARMASSPQPVPISSTRVPAPTPVRSRSRSILRPWASREVARPAPARAHERAGRRWHRLGVEQRRGVAQRRVEEQSRTGRWTGRSGGRCCAAVRAGAPLVARRPGDGQGAQPLQARRAPGSACRRPAR